MDRHEMLKNLSILDFMTVDIGLYLNTHPDDAKALSKYNSIARDAGQVRCAYESKYGPLYSFRSENKDRWQWADDPWPWENEFNFELKGDR